MADDGLPLEQFDRLFLDTASAVGAAQAALDMRHINAGEFAYALSATTVETEFGVSEEHVAFWGRRRKFELSEALQFSVVAVPDPPPCPLSSDFPPSVTVRRPLFLVDDTKRREVVQIVLKDLKNNSVESRVPGGERIDPDDLIDECDAIQDALGSVEDPNLDESVGVVVLRLAWFEEAYLIVRIGHHRDGLHIVKRTGAGWTTTVYSVRAFKHTSTLLYYEPLYRTVESLRAGELAPETSASKLPARQGFIVTQPCVSLIWAAQQKARKALCSRTTEISQFDLRDVEATLRYSVRPSDGEDEDAVRVRSQVRVEFSDARVGFSVVNPEFVLATEGRESVLSLLRAEALEFCKQLAPDFPTRYQNILGVSKAPSRALALLAYHGKRPLHQFLLVWPAPGGGDFAFSFAYHGRKFENVNLLLEINGQQRGVRPEDPIEYDRYEPQNDKQDAGFHDFFHAIRVWDLATAGELKP